MIAPLAVLAGLALFTGAGAGLMSLFALPEEGERDPLHLGWCFLAGTAFAGLLLLPPLAVDGRIPRAAFLLSFGLCLVLAAGPGRAHVRRTGVARFFGLDLFRALPVPLRVVAVLVVLLAASAALGPLVGWDERAIFGLKARILHHEGSVRGEAFTDTSVVHFHARYPLLLPLLEASLLTLRGSGDDHALKLMFVLFGVSVVLVVAGEARRLHGPGAGALWGLLLLTTPMLIGPSDGEGMTAYADLPFAAFATGATVLLGRSLEHPDRGRPLLAGLLLGAALATKQEGAIWALALAAGVLLSLRRHAAATLTNWRVWGWGWLLVLAGLLLLRRPRLTRPPFFWRATVLVVFAAYLGVFVVTPNDVYWHLATALSRLLLHLFPLAVLILAEQVGANGWPGDGAAAGDRRSAATEAEAGSLPTRGPGYVEGLPR
ncbi:MAG: glycosyltransferase family 39 protein [Holophagales bacterium]|nr:glycosyltransferase family 39 protein [Holophagales bacterium]